MTDDVDGGASSLRADLVEYLIIAMPDVASLASLAAPLAALAEHSLLRILDLVILAEDPHGAVDVVELDSMEEFAALRDLRREAGGLLSDHDLEQASSSLRPGSAGLVLVVEGRWATPLAEAAHRAGGQIAAGERIPAERVQAALAGGDDLEIGAGVVDSAEQLRELGRLHARGLLTDEQYESQQRKVRGS